MDHTAAQATFIEITFGLNSLFAVYDKFRETLAARFSDKIKECSARLKAIEPTGNSQRVSRAVMIVEGIARKHLDAQKKIADWMIPTSFTCAVVCVFVLYFDWLDVLGHWSVLLILPLPAYTVISGGNYWLFHQAKEGKMSKFKDFVSEFEGDSVLKLPELPKGKDGVNGANDSSQTFP